MCRGCLGLGGRLHPGEEWCVCAVVGKSVVWGLAWEVHGGRGPLQGQGNDHGEQQLRPAAGGGAPQHQILLLWLFVRFVLCVLRVLVRFPAARHVPRTLARGWGSVSGGFTMRGWNGSQVSEKNTDAMLGVFSTSRRLSEMLRFTISSKALNRKVLCACVCVEVGVRACKYHQQPKQER